MPRLNLSSKRLRFTSKMWDMLALMLLFLEQSSISPILKLKRPPSLCKKLLCKCSKNSSNREFDVKCNIQKTTSRLLIHHMLYFSAQTGLGRHGTKWWSYQHTNIVPDILIAGRSLGNGQPLAAVITSQQIGECTQLLMQVILQMSWLFIAVSDISVTLVYFIKVS